MRDLCPTLRGYVGVSRGAGGEGREEEQRGRGERPTH